MSDTKKHEYAAAQNEAARRTAEAPISAVQKVPGNPPVHGRVHVYGDNIDTDVIIPARYLNTSDPRELAAHCMEDLDPDFLAKVRQGDILVAGENFGCGSSREHAPLAIKAAGISCVIAASFARIFYRNAINIGLPILECPEAARALHDGDLVSLDFETGTIRQISGDPGSAEGAEPAGQTWKAQPFPPFIREIIEAGGLVEATRRRLEQRQAGSRGDSRIGSRGGAA